MPTFCPINEHGEIISELPMNNGDLLNLYSAILMSLDHNPDDPAFDASEIASFFNKEVFNAWFSWIKKIHGEERMSFTIEDWLDEWYICDFVGTFRVKIAVIKSTDNVQTHTQVHQRGHQMFA